MKEITALITETIPVDMQPLSMVEDVGFTALTAHLEEPNCTMIALQVQSASSKTTHAWR